MARNANEAGKAGVPEIVSLSRAYLVFVTSSWMGLRLVNELLPS